MVQISVNAQGLAQLERDISDAGASYELALRGAMVGAAVVLARDWARAIWVDTGAAKDSIYVMEGDHASGLIEGVVGVAAPYAAIVEKVHPRKPGLLADVAMKSEPRMMATIETLTNRLAARGGGPDNVSHPFRRDPGFTARDRNKGKAAQKRRAKTAKRKARSAQ